MMCEGKGTPFVSSQTRILLCRFRIFKMLPSGRVGQFQNPHWWQGNWEWYSFFQFDSHDDPRISHHAASIVMSMCFQVVMCLCGLFCLMLDLVDICLATGVHRCRVKKGMCRYKETACWTLFGFHGNSPGSTCLFPLESNSEF